MKITKITLTNIRCFEKFEVDLRTEAGIKNWLVILGDNGVGKSTILMSVALGLCEESGASGLLAEAREMIRYNAPEGKIRIDVAPTENYKEEAYIETTLTRSEYDEIKLSQNVYPKKSEYFDWKNLFACAYGIGRGTFGTADIFEYAVTDSVYSLFNYKSELQNPELNLRRIFAEMGEGGIKEIFKKLEAILLLPKNSIELTTKSGITVKDHWGIPMQYGAMGDGYASTLTWIMDLFGWKLQYDLQYSKHMTDLEVQGIVLIDEIENHLHPSWQKQIIKLLSQQFPKIQFIITTHSPVCVVGTTDLEDNECEIIVLKYGEKGIDSEITSPPRGKRVDQILTSYLFDLFTASDNSVKETIGKYSALYNKKRSNLEETEFQKLKKELEEQFNSSESELEKLVEEAVNKVLISMTEQMAVNLDKQTPFNFEIKRQLKNLFKKND